MSDHDTNETTTFAEMSARLEQIVTKLEGEDVPLEELIKLHGEGTQLIKRCRQMLEEAKLKVTEHQSQ